MMALDDLSMVFQLNNNSTVYLYITRIQYQYIDLWTDKIQQQFLNILANKQMNRTVSSAEMELKSWEF